MKTIFTILVFCFVMWLIADDEAHPNNTEGWQRYRTRQHAQTLESEAVTLRYFANLMQQDPNFEHKDWNG